MSMFNIADRVHEREGSALTQVKGYLKDAERVIRERDERISVLETKLRKVEAEREQLRTGEAAKFAMALEKSANITKRFKSPDEAVKAISEALDAHSPLDIEAGISPVNDIAAWRTGQL